MQSLCEMAIAHMIMSYHNYAQFENTTNYQFYYEDYEE